ncbi:LOW QUALITY PROTEIN: hypothetical protein Cgig2_018628 [Carnegiea gigantea]|uniref:Non-haem dioxygenase N-terminal domain-containing protein n=1 Tax=Carnegiea gigantea TaxID=171969 RepID=A0A9Q1KFM7_9CARY|nr:LOW QUALITY PROTEIN: hypothetical protein Cgig2_018628 [Carnegiea gigantea]
MIGLIFKVTKSQSYHLNHAGVDLNQHDPFIVRSSEVITKRLDNFELKCEYTRQSSLINPCLSSSPPPFLLLQSSSTKPSISPPIHILALPRPLSPRSRSSTMSLAHPPAVRPVTIPFSDIQDKSADLSAKIEEGFGPNGLGIIAISNVPRYPSLRKSLLHLSPRLAKLPEEEKKKLEDPHSRYNFGWSHGKEKLESGKPDILKGSFYANPILDVPTKDQALIQRYPSYCGQNIWPHSALPELEVAFKAIGRMMLDIGLLVAHHCDRYLSDGMNVGADEGLEHIICRSRCHKGRLLYYFPTEERMIGCLPGVDGIQTMVPLQVTNFFSYLILKIREMQDEDEPTLVMLAEGLTCGMFLKDGVEVACPDAAAGLYVKTRSDQIVKVSYGEDEIAYQIGETTEILSGGYLHATPHCVRAPSGKDVAGLERSTFALFMQPDWDEVLNFPENVPIHKELIPANSSVTFGEYTEKLLDKYYHLKS